VASNYSTYNSYKLVIHDTASGLEFDKSKADFKVYIVNNETPTDVTDLFNKALSSGDISCNSGSEATNACIFEITFNNLKTFSNQIGDNSKIVINYKATLSENAAIGSTGNPNKTWLVYSNNPYDTNSTGKTPEDENIVYTYQLIIKKVDGNGDALKGAEFKLYSGNPANDDNLIGTLTADEETGTIFTIKGLDAGTYTLKETSTPPGYNTVEDIKITISATHKTDDNGNLVLSALSATLSNLTDAISGDKDNGVLTGTLTANVVNRSGNTLPSAGGMGTKLLYLIGALLVLFAGTMLVAKKRTGSDR
jgi:fimbrial isopeptide formation D2 family protein